MAQDILNLNEESFERIIENLTKITPELHETFDRAWKRINALSNEWDDEDYRKFLENLRSLENELGSIDGIASQMMTEAKRKLEMIQARCNIKM